MKSVLKKITAMLMVIVQLFILNSVVAFGAEGNTEPLNDNTNIELAVSWLESVQNDDYSWGSSSLINNTFEVIELLNQLKLNKDFSNTFTWLENVNIDNNNDELSRMLRISDDKIEYLSKILDSQNIDGGFGLNGDYKSDVLDSLLVLEAFNSIKYVENQEKVLNLISYLLSCQNEDGGWGYNNKSGSNTILTARIGLAISDYLHSNFLSSQTGDEAFSKAEEYLIENDSDEITKQTFEKKLYRYMFLNRKDGIANDDEFVVSIANIQNDNGSFYNDVHLTVLATLLLAKSQEKSNTVLDIENMQINLDSNCCFVDNEYEGNAEIEILYKTNANINCQLKMSLLDGENIIKTSEYSILLQSEKTSFSGKVLSFNILESEEKDYVIKAELFNGIEKVSESNITFHVKDKSLMTEVLLIQTDIPWRSNANTTVLNNLGISYDKVTAAQAIDMDLSKYRLIIVANDQTNNTYRELFSIKDKLNTFVYNGGTLLYGVCDSGWAQGMSDPKIPGDIEIGPVTYANNNFIVDNTHPIVTAELSDGIELTDSCLYNNYASHRYFNADSLPVGTNIIFNTGNVEQPTLVEYPIGKGVVIASALTWEHAYSNCGTNIFGHKALDDLFLYAYNIVFVDTSFDVLSNINTDKESYNISENVKIHLEGITTAFQCRANGVVEILDYNNNIVAIVNDKIAAKLVATQNWEKELVWEIPNVIAGEYKVRITWFSEDDILCSEETAFNIISNGEILNTVKANKQEYTKNDKISIENKIFNTSSNKIETDLLLNAKVVDLQGNVIKTFEIPVSEISTASVLSFNNILDANELDVGSYKIITSVLKNNDEISSAFTTFNVVNKDLIQAVSGQITAQKQSEEKQKLDYFIQNTGEWDIVDANVLIRIYEANTFNFVAEFSDDANIDIGEILKLEKLIDTKELPDGNYLVILDVITETGEEISLASSGFIVERDNTLPNTDQPTINIGDENIPLIKPDKLKNDVVEKSENPKTEDKTQNNLLLSITICVYLSILSFKGKQKLMKKSKS